MLNVTPEAIHDLCTRTFGTYSPKITHYANGYTVALRNGDGDRVAAFFEPDTKPETVEHRLRELFAIKIGNAARKETLAKVFSRADIQKHQAEKLGQKPKDPQVGKWLDD